MPSNRQRREVSQPAPTASNIGESDGATTRRRSGLGEDQDRILNDQEGRIANTASSCTASLGLESRRCRGRKSGRASLVPRTSLKPFPRVVMQHLLRHLGIGQIGIAPTIDGDCAPPESGSHPNHGSGVYKTRPGSRVLGALPRISHPIISPRSRRPSINTAVIHHTSQPAARISPRRTQHDLQAHGQAQGDAGQRRPAGDPARPPRGRVRLGAARDPVLAARAVQGLQVRVRRKTTRTRADQAASSTSTSPSTGASPPAKHDVLDAAHSPPSVLSQHLGPPTIEHKYPRDSKWRRHSISAQEQHYLR